MLRFTLCLLIAFSLWASPLASAAAQGCFSSGEPCQGGERLGDSVTSKPAGQDGTTAHACFACCQCSHVVGLPEHEAGNAVILIQEPYHPVHAAAVSNHRPAPLFEPPSHA